MSEVILRNIAETSVRLHAIEQTRSWEQRRDEGVGRLKFDFHTGIHPAPETRTVWSPGKAQPLLKWLDISG